MGQVRNGATWYRLSPDEALNELGTGRDGLSREEARARLEQFGPNSIETGKEITWWSVLLHQFTSPLIYVLIAALAVTVAIQSWGDVIVITAVLLINGTIGFIQEYRAESAVQSLMEMVSPKAHLRRGGEVQEVNADDIVPGDCVVLSDGDMVPADLRLLSSHSLRVNEAALTGESVPVHKTAHAMSNAEEHLPPADQENMAFMGTAATSGGAEGLVVATGARTQLGQIAEDVRTAGEIETPLQRRMDRLAKWIAVLILIVAAVAFGVGLLMGRSVTQMFLMAVSLSVAAIPAGLPVVMTVALAVGVRRMARQHAVIRHLPAVETLGSTTSILSDKTGTLTQNRMTVRQIVAGDDGLEVTGKTLDKEGEAKRSDETIDVQGNRALYYTLLAGMLNNGANLRMGVKQGQSEDPDGDLQSTGDPMDAALLISDVKAGLARDELVDRYPKKDEVPFQTERRFSATIHHVPEDEDGPLVLVKGAPEVILQMCQRRLRANGDEEDMDREAVTRQNEELARQGLRVLAMAIGRGDQATESIKSNQPSGMTFAGMQGLLDPPRPEAINAIDNCHAAGIRVVMVTGDHAQTAAAIARQIHLDRPPRQQSNDQQGNGRGLHGDGKDAAADGDGLPEVITGQQLADVSDDELGDAINRVNVFARVKPDQKLRLVEHLKQQGKIVAVTGDGVNDAPALKSAHLGAAMGETGTDVAKEASDMVITDDNFASIYSAVEQGRTAFRNIRMATFFLLSTGAADVIIILSALAMRWELPLLPAQILWCNVVTNGIADVALGFERGDRALYRRPPRPPSEGVLDRMLIERLVLVGIWLAIGTLAVFWWVNFHRNDGLDLARVAALTTLVLFQKVHVFNCRSEDVSIFKKNLFSNKVLFIGVLTSLGVHVAALYIPWTQDVLHFQPLPWDIWVVSITVAATAILVNEVHKWFRPREHFE